MMDEEMNYLMHFWKPAPGNIVIDEEGITHIVRAVEDEYPEQLRTEHDKILFAQDVSWSPTILELEDILRGLGVSVLDDAYKYKKNLFRKSQLPREVAGVIRNIRHHAYMQGQEILEGFWDS